MKLRHVPITPYAVIYLKNLKNFLFFILQPAENMIGGNTKQNNCFSSNSIVYSYRDPNEQLINIPKIRMIPLSWQTWIQNNLFKILHNVRLFLIPSKIRRAQPI